MIQNVRDTRPTVAGDGTDMLFVGADGSLNYRETAGGDLVSLFAGQVHAVAGSPSGRYFAFVFRGSGGSPTNQIYLEDTQSNQSATAILKTPVLDADPLDNVSYADVLHFSPGEKVLIYDALSTIKRADGSLRQAWSIFSLNMETGEQSVVVPPVDEFQMGNPVFSRNSDRYIAFDASFTNGNNGIVTMDLDAGDAGLIDVTIGAGFPYYGGNDATLVYSDADASVDSGLSVYRRSLSTDKMDPVNTRTLWISDARLSVIYRRGTLQVPNTPPTVTLTSPASGSSFASLASLLLTANASDPQGSVSKVEFYSGATLLATAAQAPYSFQWNSVPAGHYRLHARAYDALGASALSQVVTVSVNPAATFGALRSGTMPGFEGELSIGAPGLYRIEASTNLQDWVPIGTAVSASSINLFDQSASGFPQRFYRAVKTP